MRRWIPIFVLVALGGTAAWAQSEGHEACSRACHESKAQCVATCGTHPNPSECDAECREQLQECVAECPM